VTLQHPRATTIGRLAAAAMAASLLVLALPAPGRASPMTTASLPATTSGLHEFTGIHSQVSHSFTTAELTAIAKQSDVVIGLAQQFKKYAATLRAVRPSIQLYTYENGMFGQADVCAQYPSSWLLHTASGAVIYSPNKNCLMNPFSTQSYGGNAGWIAYVVSRCKQTLATAPAANGCYLDQMSAVGVSGYVSGMPVDPQTGAAFTPAQYMAAVAKVGNAVAAVTHEIANGYESGRKYFSVPTSSLDSSNIQAIEAEHWLGSTQPRDAHTLSVWQSAVQMLIDSQAHGHSVFAGFGEVSTALAQWQAFNAASYLLGNNGHAWLHFDSSSGTPSWQLDAPILHMPIGVPTESHSTVAGYLHGSVYERSYTNGLVLVNPGPSTITVKLAHAYKTPSGTSTTSVTLAPYSGTVLAG
jgi:Hypothetical glycosyl hydrolase family 15